MTPDEQLQLWRQGQSVHNEERNECCPDFSCCRPNLGWPPDLREKFCLASERDQERMLMMALGAAIASAKEESGFEGEVYIAGDEANYRRKA